ncbi:hypothetical protein [Pseudothauera rhizosphaerae]|uniref:Uncharacterized protein n=1 Tax=Pseudothauera rhizosphaerae TaxID=2565932 RepID=A0A4S4ASI5_9RHOO|nr:hypothetical protein [Pseudothauera rhizosphaerae]THF62688.1 hypothetical protein E6O51_06940 [Pseudothauera rhizosphaerae]
MKPFHPFIARLARILLLLAVPVAALFHSPGPAAAQDGTQAGYRPVDLKEFVDGSRTEIAGQRIVLRPENVSFVAVLEDPPAPQRAEYLTSVLHMMQASEVPEVRQRIVLRYGDERFLTAYIEAGVARRLAETAKVGERRRFYALHVYNYSKGPALLITSFGDAE